MSLRIIFMGTPDFSVPALVELVGHGHEIVACYSQPPRPAGRRGLELTKSSVHEKAESFGIPVFTPTSLKDDAEHAQFASLDADVAVVIAYGLLLPKPVLEAPRFGCYNGHASLLPRWRGAAPIQRAIMAGDNETGTMVMKMEQGLDTGPIALSEKLVITSDMTAGESHDALSLLTANLMVRAMAALERDSLTLTPQSDDGVLYAKKIDKGETRVDWSRSAQEVYNHIRGLAPFPGSWCEMVIGEKPQRVKLLASRLGQGSGEPGTRGEGLTVYCGQGAVELIRVQRAGKQAQSAVEFLRGNTIEAII